MKRIISLFLSLLMVLVSFSAINAFADEASTTEPVTTEEGTTEPEIVYDIYITEDEMKKNARSVIEKCLKYAKENATAEKPITINVPSGSYNLSDCLHIYSNTNLILQSDTTLNKTFSDGNMLKCGVQTEYNYAYDGYKNINIIGGIWDEKYVGTSCAMRFGHCENVTLSNVTIKNNNNSHHMEFAGVNNFKVLNCTFSGYKRTNTSDGTALQIDTVHTTYHFPSYTYYDDTPCKNVTIQGCTFDNVYSGVGSYNGVIGSYFDNIVIKDNVFTGIRDKAIACFNYVNSTISNNTINSSTIGILFEYYPFEKLSSRFYNPNSKSASTKINTNSNSFITKNIITVTRPVSRSNSSGIAAYGGKISSSSSLKSGNYIVNNLTISDNTINVNTKNASGMWFEYLNNSSISGNRIKGVAGAAGGYNGIKLLNSQQNSVTSNIVNYFDNSVALQTSSKGNTFIKNTFKNTVQYALAVDSTSTAIVPFGNKYKTLGKGKVLVRKKVLNTNVIKVKGVKANKGTLSWKRDKTCSGYKIYRSTNKSSGYEEIASVKGNKNTTYKDGSAKKGKTYYYKVATYKAYKYTAVFGKASSAVKSKK